MDDKKSILFRINNFRENIKMSKSSLAAAIGIEQTTLNNQFLGKRSLSLDLVINLLNTYTDLSAEWLIRGTGNMLISENINSDSNIDRINKLVDTITTLQDAINEKNKTIKLLEEEIRTLKQRH